jgi:hypothetical protein
MLIELAPEACFVMSARKKPSGPAVVHDDIEGAEKRLQRLKVGFRRVSSRWEHRYYRRHLYSQLKLPIVGAISCLALLGFFLWSPWGAILTLRHLAAFPNCAAAEAVGLAPARVGEPGYWPHHDADHDGVACEAAVWHRRGSSHDRRQKWLSPPASPNDLPSGPGWVIPPK